MKCLAFSHLIFRFPFVGGLPFLRGSGSQPNLLQGLEENVAKYGTIFGFYFGQTPAVVLSDYSLIKEAFKSDKLAARPSIEPMHEIRPGANPSNLINVQK